MRDQSENELESLYNIRVLQNFLKSEMHIVEADDGGTRATINVRNTAPLSCNGSTLVFVGVGLNINYGRQENMRRINWASRVKTSRPSDQEKVRLQFEQGDWISGQGNQRFPMATSDEESHGQVLFPGESLIYDIELAQEELPYLNVKVEGTVSRRHLFHISRQMTELRKWTIPLIFEALEAIDQLDYSAPVRSLREKMPEFTPNTTLSEIDTFRTALEDSISEIGDKKRGMREIYKVSPNQEIREYLNTYIADYIANSMKLFPLILEALNSGDTAKMREVSGEINKYRIREEEIEHQNMELKAGFGLI